jgi:hypothetical protein
MAPRRSVNRYCGPLARSYSAHRVTPFTTVCTTKFSSAINFAADRQGYQHYWYPLVAIEPRMFGGNNLKPQGQGPAVSWPTARGRQAGELARSQFTPGGRCSGDCGVVTRVRPPTKDAPAGFPESRRAIVAAMLDRSMLELGSDSSNAKRRYVFHRSCQLGYLSHRQIDDKCSLI